MSQIFQETERWEKKGTGEGKESMSACQALHLTPGSSRSSTERGGPWGSSGNIHSNVEPANANVVPKSTGGQISFQEVHNGILPIQGVLVFI